jgi:hypothetical protein
MKSNRECAECVRLWRKYQSATMEHIELCGKQRIAQLQRDDRTLAGLEEKVTMAEQNRTAAREGIVTHEAAVHGQPPTQPVM